MNILLANIYGTHGGLEKVAHELPEGVQAEDLPTNLSDLALLLIADESGDDIEKTAEVHKDVLGNLIEFDSAGRHIAQAEFSEMEKSAAEGDPSALEEFFADADEAPSEADQRAAVVETLKAELKRRGIQR